MHDLSDKPSDREPEKCFEPRLVKGTRVADIEIVPQCVFCGGSTSNIERHELPFFYGSRLRGREVIPVPSHKGCYRWREQTRKAFEFLILLGAVAAAFSPILFALLWVVSATGLFDTSSALTAAAVLFAPGVVVFFFSMILYEIIDSRMEKRVREYALKHETPR